MGSCPGNACREPMPIRHSDMRSRTLLTQVLAVNAALVAVTAALAADLHDARGCRTPPPSRASAC